VPLEKLNKVVKIIGRLKILITLFIISAAEEIFGMYVVLYL
jgi:hypothetical protein